MPCMSLPLSFACCAFAFLLVLFVLLPTPHELRQGTGVVRRGEWRVAGAWPPGDLPFGVQLPLRICSPMLSHRLNHNPRWLGPTC